MSTGHPSVPGWSWDSVPEGVVSCSVHRQAEEEKRHRLQKARRPHFLRCIVVHVADFTQVFMSAKDRHCNCPWCSIDGYPFTDAVWGDQDFIHAPFLCYPFTGVLWEYACVVGCCGKWGRRDGREYVSALHAHLIYYSSCWIMHLSNQNKVPIDAKVYQVFGPYSKTTCNFV